MKIYLVIRKNSIGSEKIVSIFSDPNDAELFIEQMKYPLKEFEENIKKLIPKYHQYYDEYIEENKLNKLNKLKHHKYLKFPETTEKEKWALEQIIDEIFVLCNGVSKYYKVQLSSIEYDALNIILGKKQTISNFVYIRLVQEYRIETYYLYKDYVEYKLKN